MTKKEFRNILNERFKDNPKWKNYQYHQRTRQYGDYLYFQDRERFNMYYEEEQKAVKK